MLTPYLMESHLFGKEMIDHNHIICLTDLTSLDELDTTSSIHTLCTKALNCSTTVASVCVYPRFLKYVKELLKNTHIKLTTVVNFPLGSDSISNIYNQIDYAYNQGADEIDMVIPYHDYIKFGASKTTIKLIATAKEICRNKVLKVIIETGALKSDKLIKIASKDVIKGGADFIKTSTGKYEIGATPEAIKSIIDVCNNYSGTNIGIKVSGGVRTVNIANLYYQLVKQYRGEKFLSKKYLRFGSSNLLDQCI